MGQSLSNDSCYIVESRSFLIRLSFSPCYIVESLFCQLLILISAESLSFLVRPSCQLLILISAVTFLSSKTVI